MTMREFDDWKDEDDLPVSGEGEDRCVECGVSLDVYGRHHYFTACCDDCGTANLEEESE